MAAKIIVIGSNSKIYQDTKNIISSFGEVFESRYQPSDEILDIHADLCLVFNGVVSNDDDLLLKIESYHDGLCRLLSASNFRKVGLISSSAVYGDGFCCFDENMICQPSTSYGKSKLRIESLYRRIERKQIAILRLGNYLGLDAVGAVLKMQGRAFIDCDKMLRSSKRTYVDKEVIKKMMSYLLQSQMSLDILNIGRLDAEEMFTAYSNIDANVIKRKNSSYSCTDITLDTRKLWGLKND